MKQAIAVLGAGAWGTALALVLARNANLVHLWSVDVEHVVQMQQQRINAQFLPGYSLPANIKIYHDISTCLARCEDILFAIPSSAFKSVLLQTLPYLAKYRGISWATKGLDPSSGNLLHKVVATELGADFPVAILSGPSFATEVAQAIPTAITLASNNAIFADALLQRFHQKSFRVYSNDDIIGVQIGGCVKNVLAIATGISDALGFGANTRAAIITRGLAEMMRIGQALGGQNKTFMGLAGMGDLILTCTDNQSRNRRFGLALGAGKTTQAAIDDIGQVVEGAANAKQVYLLAKKHQVEMPICQQVYQVIECGMSAQQAVENLLSRDAKAE
jgi:glycerol-3-phosphate dehydrogenase (NAD(P)+)